MKTSYFIILVLAGALCFTSYKWLSGSNQNDETPAPDSAELTNVTINDILTRTSVRAYSDREVTDGQIDTLLMAAMAAPTARDCRPWQFVVIRDREILDSIASGAGTAKMASEAAAGILVCGDMSIALKDREQEFWIQDCSAAAENLLLAAHAMGLGAVWCGIYPMEPRIDFYSKVAGLPEDVVPLCFIPVGYPKAAVTPKEKFNRERIHLNRY